MVVFTAIQLLQNFFEQNFIEDFWGVSRIFCVLENVVMEGLGVGV